MSYAVVEIGGGQYKVSPGEEFTVAYQKGSPGDKLMINRVLVLVEDEKMVVGTPVVDGRALVATLVSQGKSRKVRIGKYKAKSRYQKQTGFRGRVSILRIDSFETEKVESKTKGEMKAASRKKK